jgi:hypothetical protein
MTKMLIKNIIWVYGVEISIKTRLGYYLKLLRHYYK